MPFIFMQSRIKCLGTKLGLAQYSKHNLLVINDRRNNNTYIKVVLLKNFIIYTNLKLIIIKNDDTSVKIESLKP